MVRIQLANNFQVVELNFEDIYHADPQQLDMAIDLVNDLGTRVNSSASTVTTKKESPSEGQIKFAKQLKIDISKMDKEQARIAIKDAVAKKVSDK